MRGNSPPELKRCDDAENGRRVDDWLGRGRVPLLIGGALVWCLAATNAVAQNAIRDPRDTPAGVLGAQLGDVGAAIMTVRNDAMQRQARIVSLRRELERCGQCATASALTHELAEAEEADRRFFDTTSRIAFGSGAGAGTMRFLDRLTDPLNLRGEARAAAAQEAADREFTRSLKLKYCYATTGDMTSEQACNEQITQQDFAQDGMRVHALCERDADRTSCVQKSSLVNMMVAAIAAKCSMDRDRVPLPVNQVLTECKHQSRGPPPQNVQAKIEKLTEYTNGTGQGLERAIFSRRPVPSLWFNDLRVKKAWAETGVYQTVDCSYKLVSGDPIGTVRFWFGEAPPGAADLVARVRQVVPEWETVSDRGITQLGGAGITVCPPTIEDAKTRSRDLSLVSVSSNPAQFLVSSSIRGDGGNLIRLVHPKTARGLNDDVADKRIDEIIKINPKQFTPLLECKYAPVRINLAGQKGIPADATEGYYTAIYFYWYMTTPNGWDELREIIEADDNLLGPDGKMSRRQAHAISRRAYADCPPTLADAQRRASTYGEPDPWLW